MRRPLSRRIATAAAAMVALGWVVAGSVPPALAHTGIDSATPGPGQRVAPGVEELALTFSGLRADGPRQVTVTGPAEQPLPVGEPVLVNATTLCVAVAPLAAGVHTVDYLATSQDGHPVEGSFLFEVAPDGEVLERPAACEGIALPAPVAGEAGTEDPAAGRPAATAIVAAVLGTVVAVAVAVGAVLSRRSRRTRPTGPEPRAATDQRPYL